jgi:hypothetical protein
MEAEYFISRYVIGAGWEGRALPPICMHCEAADGVQCGRPDQGDLCGHGGWPTRLTGARFSKQLR